MTDDKPPAGAENNPSDETTNLKSDVDIERNVEIPLEDVAAEKQPEKIKFINGGAAEAHVDIEDGSVQKDFTGMSKEELMQYANDPFWVRLRIFLLIFFWLAWFAMLIAAIVIIILAPKCPPRKDLQWWQKDVICQVYPRSFQDTNGDGVGDLKGVEKRLDHFEFLGVKALWLSPFFSSPMKDFGYDVSDFKAVDPIFGTMEEFDSLRRSLHRKDMRLILDFIPNHTSDKHTWFVESRKNNNEDNAFRDYYVWHPGKTTGSGIRQPPNNWLSVFGGSAWTLDPTRNEYYLHQFLPEQPDLNFREPKVKEAIKEVLRFWLDKGVDGFRVDALKHLVEVGNQSRYDEPANPNVAPGLPTDHYDNLDHIYSTNQPETFAVLAEWRALMEEYTQKTGRYRALIAEVYGTMNQTMAYYGNDKQKGADMPFNFNLIGLKKDCHGKCVHNLVDGWISNMPQGVWPNWVTGNHDTSRVATRVSEKFVNAVNMLLLLLPGTPFTYYGEEIGMHDVNVSWEQTQDPAGKRWGQAKYLQYSRDPQRTPMQWNTSPNGGFSTANKTWLPVAADYRARNVEVQKGYGAGVTNIEVFQALTKLRGEPSFQWGEIHYAVTDDNVFSFVRQAEGFPGYLVVLNFGTSNSHTDFHDNKPTLIPKSGTIVANTANFANSDIQNGKSVELNNLVLHPGQGVVFKWELPE